MADECVHAAGIRDVTLSGLGCEECLKIGSPWVHLRLVVDLHPRAAFVTRAPRRFDNSSCLEDGSRRELAVQISKCEGQPQEQQGDRAMIQNAWRLVSHPGS